MTVNHDQNKMPARSNEESMATKRIRDEGYALPSPKSSRASKQIDNITSVNKVCTYVCMAYENCIHVALFRCCTYVYVYVQCMLQFSPWYSTMYMS